MQNCTNTVNVVVYGTNESDARNLTESIVGNTQENGVYLGQLDNYTVRGFVRFVGGSSYTLPLGVTDAIVVHVGSTTDSSYSSLQEYLTQRATVPVRVIVSEDQSVSTFAQENGVLFTSEHSSVRNLVLGNVQQVREKLSGLFNKYAQSNLLSEEGFNNLLKEYSEGVVDDHTYLFSEYYNPSQTISFEHFYYWWVLGRNDQYFYREVPKMFQFSQDVLNKLTNNVSVLQNLSGKEYSGKLDVSPQQAYTNGIRFALNTYFGEEYDKLAQGFSNSQLTSPFAFSLEFGLQDPSKVQEIIDKLNQLKEMVKALNSRTPYFFRIGLDIQFRNAGNRFFVDFVISGLGGLIILSTFPQNANFKNLTFSGNTELSFSTGFSPVQVYNNSLEQILRNATNISLQGSGSFINVQTITSVITFLFSLARMHPSEQKYFEYFLNGLQILKLFGFELKYDSNELFQTISEIVCREMGGQPSNDSSANLQGPSEMFSQQQQMLPGFLEMGKGMLTMLADFLDLFRNLNVDNLSASFYANVFRAGARVTLELPGVTEFLNNHFLN